MATKQDFTIIKGRTRDVIVTVTGLSSWTGIDGKMAIRHKNAASAELTIDDSAIDTGTNKITFSITATQSAGLDTGTNYEYEVILFKSDRSYVKTACEGRVTVEVPILEDPTA